MSAINLKEDLCRMARFGANISDSYGCYIFIPNNQLTNPEHTTTDSDDTLVMAGFHSLSNDVIRDCQIACGSGLVGWVSRHKRSIHVSPFERDSRTLGFYYNDQQLKSFIGIPVFFDHIDPGADSIAGVIACDSKKSFAFSKIQGKLLEDLACEISNTLKLAHLLHKNGVHKLSWQRFTGRCEILKSSLGPESIEVLRVKVGNYANLEKRLGTAASIALVEQVFRLVEQALPPHFPVFKTPNGDLVMVVDNMMTTFIENKILAICAHCADNPAFSIGQPALVEVNFTKRSGRNRKLRGMSVEELINSTAASDGESDGSSQKNSEPIKGIELIYEYKRA